MSEVYEQVIITCTTINVITIIFWLTIGIADKIGDRRRKKKDEAENQKQDNQ